MKSTLRRIADSFDYVAGNLRFSLQGEDAVALAFLRQVKSAPSRAGWFFGRERFATGQYVDVGAYAPKRWSNTYAFYRLGWKGITVEPNPEAAAYFQSVRPRDKHVVAAIANGSDTVYYYSAGYSAGNYVSRAAEAPRPGFQRYQIPATSLAAILDDPFLQSAPCDLLSVDCEGFDLEVLKSNDWERHRPRVVIAEDHARGGGDPRESDLVGYMAGVGYRPFSRTLDSVLLCDTRGIER